jgi:hypothetical protein
MPKKDDELLELFRKSEKAGRNLDPGIYRDIPEGPNEELNKILGAPKGTIIKPVPMPEPKLNENELIDFFGKKVRRGDIKPAPMPMLEKKGGKIDLSKCKVNTAKKNPSSSGW